MWIYTQDKRIINADKYFYIKPEEGKTFSKVTATTPDGRTATIGIYDTISQARCAVDMIFEAMKSYHNTFEMPSTEQLQFYD